MKKTFTKEYIMQNKGCYEPSDVESIKCINNKTITIDQLYRDLPIKDFCWFLVKKCDLTIKEKRLFAVHVAEFVLPVFEKKYPKDDRPRKAIEAAKSVINEDTEQTRSTAYAAYYAAADATADATAYAAAYAADAAAYAAYYAADAAAYAADAAYSDKQAYRSHVFDFVKSIL